MRCSVNGCENRARLVMVGRSEPFCRRCAEEVDALLSPPTVWRLLQADDV